MTRAPGKAPRPPPPEGPWLSTKHWRRALALALERGLSAPERRALFSRLARERGVGAARRFPRLRLLGAGSAPSARFPREPGPREAA